jgi:hypothetical protein
LKLPLVSVNKQQYDQFFRFIHKRFENDGACTAASTATSI